VIERRPTWRCRTGTWRSFEKPARNIEAAIGVLRRAVDGGVTDPRVRALLGEYLSDAGKVAGGHRHPRAARAGPGRQYRRVERAGIAYARASRTQDARRMFERLAEAMPGSSGPLENLGVLALGQRDVRGARQYFDRALAISPIRPVRWPDWARPPMRAATGTPPTRPGRVPSTRFEQLRRRCSAWASTWRATAA